MEEYLYTVSFNQRVVGVCTSHIKAVQMMFIGTLMSDCHLTDYVYDFGIEFYTFTDESGTEKVYEIQEFTPNVRA